jgi:hypothetical protein
MPLCTTMVASQRPHQQRASRRIPAWERAAARALEIYATTRTIDLGPFACLGGHAIACWPADVPERPELIRGTDRRR